MTERLYYHDSRLLEFDAIAVAHAGDARHVVLDRTAFYPTSGGQPHDAGVLGGAHVTDVIDEDRRIVHVVDAAVPLGPVHGTVDGFRRRDHAEQHTAQHLVSALAGDRLGWDTVSVHFGEDHSSIEFATPAASDEQLRALEQWASEIVGEAREVSIGFEDATFADRTGLRKPSVRTGDIRVITIAGLDRSACGGTHLSRTSEVGSVLLLGVEKIRGHVRIGFLAGGRVLAHARADAALLAAMAREACHPSPGRVDVPLDLGQRDRPLSDTAVEVSDRVARILPALVEETALRAPLVFGEAVAVEVARIVDPAQRR